MRRTLSLLLVTVAALAAAAALWVGPLRGDDPPAAPTIVPPDFNKGAAWEVNEKSLKAIEKGLAWLAARQNADGSIGGGSGGYGNRSAAITAMAGLAFLADGSVPGRGRYSAQVEKCMEATLASTSESNGLIAVDGDGSPMYGHGFATLFLAEVYGMTGNEQVREKLRQAVRLIVNTQNKQGGWRYQPVPNDADISVTICQVMALRAARNAGIHVPKQTIDKAIEYVRKSQCPDGGFAYMIGMGGGAMGSGFPRSAAGVASLFYSGVYTGKEIENGMKYLMQPANRPSGGMASGGGHFFYGHYYAVQAFFIAGGKYWQDWFPNIRDFLVGQQQPAGCWTEGVGPEYATALALIILQVPNRYLPILER
jgi:hypothetical protein